MRLPFEVADYVDFYSSREHATNLGRSSAPIRSRCCRTGAGCPSATTAAPARSSSAAPTSSARAGSASRGRRPGFGPTRAGSTSSSSSASSSACRGTASSPVDAFADHVFGVVLVNDWSARDIQAWEYLPLGPFLGKSFQTSISAWVTPLALLEPRRVEAPPQEPPPLPHLAGGRDWALDLELELELNGEVVSRGNARTLYWTMPQQLAHATSNGASVRTGDLMATGAISGTRARLGGLAARALGAASASSPTATRSCCAPAAARSSWARSAAASSPARPDGERSTHELRPPRPAVRRGSRSA